LKYIKENLFDCLHDYLQQIVDNLTERENLEIERPKLICLTSWILELKLNEIYDYNQINEFSNDPKFKSEYD
jgi:hypothetical protein